MPPRILPAIGASQNSHGCLIAQPPTNRAGPGTAIRVHAGTYGGGTYISNVSGEPSAPIWIGGVPGESKPLIQNGGEGLHLTKVSYLVIHDLEEVRIVTVVIQTPDLDRDMLAVWGDRCRIRIGIK